VFNFFHVSFSFWSKNPPRNPDFHFRFINNGIFWHFSLFDIVSSHLSIYSLHISAFLFSKPSKATGPLLR
jgi:hypothetical protein